MTQCHHCQNGTQTIPGRYRGLPEGICLRCHVATCRGHGARDPNYPRWICVVCDSTLLAVSAIQANGATSIIAQLTTSAIFHSDRGLYTNLESFVESRPEMEWLLAKAPETLKRIETTIESALARNIWESLSPEGRDMFSAAISLAIQLEISKWELIDIVRIFLEEIGHDR